MSNDALKIPKSRLAIEICLAGAKARRVEVFVTEHRPPKPPHHLLMGLLEQQKRFLPSHETDEDQWLMFNLDNVYWVSTQRKESLDHIELYDRHYQVKLDLRDGSTLSGEVLYSPPMARARLVDYLNQPERFFFLYRMDRVYLVNKSYVVSVIEVPTRPTDPKDPDQDGFQPGTEAKRSNAEPETGEGAKNPGQDEFKQKTDSRSLAKDKKEDSGADD